MSDEIIIRRRRPGANPPTGTRTIQPPQKTAFKYRAESDPPVFVGPVPKGKEKYVSHAVVVDLLVGPDHMDAAQAQWWVKEAIRYYYCAQAGQFDGVYLRGFRTLRREDFTEEEKQRGEPKRARVDAHKVTARTRRI